jgi:hypothetical protein
VRIAPWLVASLCALACTRTGLTGPNPDAGGVPSCAARAGDPCCASADGGAATCGGAGLACAGAACTCLAQATAVYDTTPVVRRVDGTVWVAADRAHFTEILGPNGHFRATDLAVSGSTAYGTAIGCVIEDGAVWCFPLVTPVHDSTDLGAGFGRDVTTAGAVQVMAAGTSAGPRPLTGARQLSATMSGNGAAFCAVTDAGIIWCWGYGIGGILGRGDQTDSPFAQPVLIGAGSDPFTGAVEVRVGYDSACARTTAGQVWCWGDNSRGQTGIANSGGLPGNITPFPAGPLQLPSAAVRLAASPGRTHCAVLLLGWVACWGANESEQAGADNRFSFVAPTTILSPVAGLPRDSPLEHVVDLAPDRGMKAMCATTSEGALYCWGHPFPPAGAPDATTAVPIAIPLPGAGGAPLLSPLSSYGGLDGSLVYIDPNGKLTLGAGGLPFEAQLPCDL